MDEPKSEDLKKHIDTKMSPEGKVKEKNRIRQLAFKARDKMPKDYKSFCLVVDHLARNAHRYYNNKGGPDPSKAIIKCDSVKIDVKQESLPPEDRCHQPCQSDATSNQCKDVNKLLREIRTFKRQNRILEQQERVEKLKKLEGTYRSISAASGMPSKTVHEWCATPKQ